ncbi:tetratricopeptide repeat protein [Kitasatospora sp. NPDC097605]|uniref:tetratricopeptide repeat protein n=1 Tax=Kitasatospora sp. NPDC097605 TaxID=3157226 RepID=UPI0033313FA9
MIESAEPDGVEQQIVVNKVTHSTVHGDLIQAGTYVRQDAPPPEPQWPVLVGALPVLASAFQPRAAVRTRIDEARAGHETVVLTQVLAGGGGVGKSQLAADYAHRALRPDGGVDVVVWAPAADPVAVLATYAEAALAVQVPGAVDAPAEVEPNARRFLNWLRSTDRGWLVVLDDVTDFTATGPLWPGSSRQGNGRVLATTRQRGAHASGGGRALVPVDVYSVEESAGYLRDRLTSAGFPYLLDERAGELAEALGRLPLALAHAAAFMVNQHRTCADYLELFHERSRTLDSVLPPEADTELYGRPVATALLISLEAAQRTEPKGLAEAAVRLAALLDPAGHPRALWTTEAATDYLARHRTPAESEAPAEPAAPEPPANGRTARRRLPRFRRRGPSAEPSDEPPAPPPVSADEALTVLAVLHSYNLIASRPAGDPEVQPWAAPAHREVTIHALTARAARDTSPEPQQHQVAAIWALSELWPEEEHTDHRLSTSLRTNTAVLQGHVGDAMHHYPGSLLREKAGISLLHAGLHQAAVTHWSEEVDTLTRGLGPEHPRALTARANLAAAYREAGRSTEAAALLKQVAVAHEELHGADHPGTLTVLAGLAMSYSRAGLDGDAIALKERVLAARERVLGPLHPDTVSSRSDLAVSYSHAGRTDEALALEQRVVGELRGHGTDHPNALTARANLAGSYRQAGRLAEAIAIQEEILAGRERALGPEHAETHHSRVELGLSYCEAGRAEEGIPLVERGSAGLEQVLGADHPEALGARGDLAVAYRRSGRNEEAAELGESVLQGRSRVLGREHPDTLLSAANLINAYAESGRTEEALELAEVLHPRQERVFGPHSEPALIGRDAIAVLRIRRGLAFLARDPARAGLDAMAAIAAVGPHVRHRLPTYDDLLEAAHGLAARAAERATEHAAEQAGRAAGQATEAADERRADGGPA